MNYDMFDLPDLELLNEKETRLYITLVKQGDDEALRKLVEHNLKLVLKVTYRFKNTEYDLQDLFQIGVIGLIKAARAFDLERGVKFSTYAVSKIIGEIRLHLRDDGIIKVSRSLKKIARVVRQKEDELKKKSGYTPSINELEEETGFKKEDIIRALEANKKPASIYQTINNNGESKLYLIDRIEDKKSEFEYGELDKLELVEVLRRLDTRSRKIIFMRYFEDRTQQEVAEEIGVSQVQISRLEKKILSRLRETL